MTASASLFHSFAEDASGASDATTGENRPMTDVSHAEVFARERGRKGEIWEFHALVAATYPLFLANTVARRAIGANGPKIATGRRSVFSEAYTTAAATLACAFMG